MSARRILHAVRVQHYILVLALVALMVSSVPIGAHLVYGSHIPAAGGGAGPERIMYGFGALWAAFAAMIGVALAGPRVSIAGAARILSPARGARALVCENHMAAAATWFAVLVLASALIDAVQSSQGVEIVVPEYAGDLERYYDATKAPILEELGFRALLVGVPLALGLARRGGARAVASALWHPRSVLPASSARAALVLIIASSSIFGALHVLGDGSWSPGKATQAAGGGMILGWVYYRHGLLPAVMVHWATNYALLTFVHAAAASAGVAASAADGLASVAALEALLVAAGAAAVALLAAERALRSRMRARAD